MRNALLSLFMLMVSSTAVSAGKDDYENCLNSKKTIEELNLDDFTWKPAQASDVKYPILKVWGVSIPVVANRTPEIAVFNNSLSKRIAIMDIQNETIQTIESNTYHSRIIDDNTWYSIFSGDDLFSVFIESISVTSSDIDCDAFLSNQSKNENYILNLKNLTLLAVKAHFKPYKGSGVIAVPSGFIMTSDSGFEYVSMQSGVSTVSAVITSNPNDVHSFINTLNQPGEELFHNEIFKRVVSIWDDESPASWQELHSYLQGIEAPEVTLDSVADVIDRLSKNEQG